MWTSSLQYQAEGDIDISAETRAESSFWTKTEDGFLILRKNEEMPIKNIWIGLGSIFIIEAVVNRSMETLLKKYINL